VHICGELVKIDIRFLDVTKVVSPEGRGFWESKVSKCQKRVPMRVLFTLLVLGDVLGVSGTN
jgi:hypothetical protein